MQAKYATMETSEIGIEVSATHMERIQQVTKEFVASTSDALRLLTDLLAKLVAPARVARDES